jgi:hypothetical protein
MVVFAASSFGRIGLGSEDGNGEVLFGEIFLGHPLQIGGGDGADSIEVGLIKCEVTGDEPTDTQRGGLVCHRLALAGVVGQHLVAGFLLIQQG